MTDYQTWARQYPEAAQALFLITQPEVPGDATDQRSEAYAQQQGRMQAGRMGGVLWRNNVGASKAKTQHKCPNCQFKFEEKHAPIRWGLCNDSMAQNKKFKSSDGIGIRPVLITPEMVGKTIGQFWAVEFKAPGVPINMKDEHIAAQHAYLALVQRFGGYSEFSYGPLT